MNEALSYFNAIFWIITFIWIIWLITKRLENILNKIYTKTESKIDDIIAEFFINFLKSAKYIIAIYIWINLAIIPDFLKDILDKIFYISFIFVILVLSSSLINSTFKILERSKKNSDLSKHVFPMIKKTLVVFVWIIWIITIISNLGYNVWALITWAWVWWLALALAAQKSVSNIFWALSIIINKPFKIWELVRIGGFTWVVKEIWLTYLVLRDAWWNKILIPNENLISSAIENLTQRDNRRTDFSIWVIYDTSLIKLQKAMSIIESVLEKYIEEKTIESYRVHFDNFWDFSLNINATYFSLINDEYKAFLKQKENINLEIKEKFEKAKIEMAFPTQEVIVKKA